MAAELIATLFTRSHPFVLQEYSYILIPSKTKHICQQIDDIYFRILAKIFGCKKPSSGKNRTMSR